PTRRNTMLWLGKSTASRRRFIAGLAGLATTGALVACSAPAAPTAAPAAPPTAAPAPTAAPTKPADAAPPTPAPAAPTQAQATSAAAAPAAPKQGETTIDFWWGWTPDIHVNALNAASRRFEEKNAGIKVRTGQHNWGDKLFTALAGGNPPDMFT